MRRLDCLRDVVVTVADTLVTANFSVLTLSLLHQCLQLGVIALRNGLGLHLDGKVATGSLNGSPDVDDGLFQTSDTLGLISACASKHIQRRRNKSDLDLHALCVLGLGGSERGLDSIDTLIAEAGDFDVGTDLGGLRGESLADVQLQLVVDDLVRECDLLPHLGVAMSRSVSFLDIIQLVQSSDIRDRQLESVNGVAVFAVQGPGYALIQRLDGCLGLLGNVSHDGVDHLALVVSLLALDNILGRNTSF